MRLSLEELEPRTAPAANLKMVSLQLVDANLNPISQVVAGDPVLLRADWRSTGLNSIASYLVRFKVDGVPVGITVPPGIPNGPLFYITGGWYFAPGTTHRAQVILDVGHAVQETSERDNTHSLTFTAGSAMGPPTRFVLPITGIPNQDFSIINYVDVDPRVGPALDYRNGFFRYDGHDAVDLGLANFAHMDAGVPVRAAAAGTVILVQDGNYDRETTANQNPPNAIEIDHGNGWVTRYLHLAANSITVQVGDTVVAGQPLGLVGSSGDSSDPHLHFGVFHKVGTNYFPVETFLDPLAFWADPLPYQGDTDPGVLDFGVTNYQPDADLKERPSEVHVLPTSFTGPIYFWFRISQLNVWDNITFNWYQPGGMLDTSVPITVTAPQIYLNYATSLDRNWSLFPGTWQVALVVNGQEKARASFDITTGPGVPDIYVTQGSTYLLDGRITPVDFGSATVGGPAATQAFTIANKGFATLTLANLNLPPGFSLASAFPSSISPGGQDTFTVQLDTTQAGAQFGAIRFDTNDPSAAPLSFPVKGTVTGMAPAGAPVLALSGPAVVYQLGQAPILLSGQATVTDLDSANFNGGLLQVEFAAGGNGNDHLAIRDEGAGNGQIGVSGNAVTYSSTSIGSFTGGTGGNPLQILFNASATPAAVAALLRNITYANGSSADTAPRYVRWTLTDDTNLTSNLPIRTVILTQPATNTAPLLNNAGTPMLTPVGRSAPAATITGDVIGALVSGSITDPEVGAQQGIAVIGLSGTSNGTWEYSTDGGRTWSPLASPSPSTARLLRDVDRVRFIPNPGFTGTATLDYRAWDRTSGQVGDTADATVNGGATAFSTAVKMASVKVAAPLTSIREDTFNPPGDKVSGIVSSAFKVANPAAALGIAVVATPGTGTWQYSLNAGMSWHNFPAVAPATALLLRASDRVRFLPAANFNGLATITYHAWDRSTGNAGGVGDVSGPGFSVAADDSLLRIILVNDRPVLDVSSSPALPPLGDTVASLLVDAISDVDAGAQRGIAIVGLTGTKFGVWQFSENGGTSWFNIVAVAPTQALLLRDTDLVRFVPRIGFSGMVNIKYRAWDQSKGRAGGTASTMLGTAFSTAMDTAIVTIP